MGFKGTNLAKVLRHHLQPPKLPRGGYASPKLSLSSHQISQLTCHVNVVFFRQVLYTSFKTWCIRLYIPAIIPGIYINHTSIYTYVTWCIFPICFMYGICAKIDQNNDSHVGNYSIHGTYGSLWCMHACTYLCYLSIDLSISISNYLCKYVSMYWCMYLHTYLCIDACKRACMHACVQGCTYARMHVCIYIYIHNIHAYIL